MLYQRFFLLLSCFLLISCMCNQLPVDAPKPIDGFLASDTDVVIGKGIDYETKRQVLLDPLTGELIKPCNVDNYSYKRTNKKLGDVENDPCTNEIVETGQSEESLADLISKSRKLIPVIVKRDGKVIDENAVAIVSISVLYKGSHCETNFSLGTTAASCSTDTAKKNSCMANIHYRGKANLPGYKSYKSYIDWCENHVW